MRAVPSGLGSKEFGVWCIEGSVKGPEGNLCNWFISGENSNGFLGSKIRTLDWPKICPGIGLGSGPSSVLSFRHNLSSGSFYRTSSPCRTPIITQSIACSAVQCLGPEPPSHAEGELCLL